MTRSLTVTVWVRVLLPTVFEEEANKYHITLIYPLYDTDVAAVVASLPSLQHNLPFLQA